MIGIVPADRDVLRFLWFQDPGSNWANYALLNTTVIWANLNYLAQWSYNKSKQNNQ